MNEFTITAHLWSTNVFAFPFGRMVNKWVMKWFAWGHIQSVAKVVQKFLISLRIPLDQACRHFEHWKVRWILSTIYVICQKKNQKPLRRLIVFCLFLHNFAKKWGYSSLYWSVFNIFVSGKRVQHPFLYLTVSASYSNSYYTVYFFLFLFLLSPFFQETRWTEFFFPVIYTELWHFLHFCDLGKSNFMINTEIQDRPQ